MLVGVARGGAMHEDRGGEPARAPQVLALRPRRRSATPSSAAALAAPPPLKYGLARLSPATSPGRGAQLASITGAEDGAFARAVSRPFSDRAARAPHDHGGVGLTLLGRRARRSERSASGGDAPEARGACAQRSGAPHVSRRGPNSFWAAGRCIGACRREVRGGAPGMRRAGARTFLAPRAGAAVVALSGFPRRLLRVLRALRGNGRQIPIMETQDLTPKGRKLKTWPDRPSLVDVPSVNQPDPGVRIAKPSP